MGVKSRRNIVAYLLWRIITPFQRNTIPAQKSNSNTITQMNICQQFDDIFASLYIKDQKTWFFKLWVNYLLHIRPYMNTFIQVFWSIKLGAFNWHPTQWTDCSFTLDAGNIQHLWIPLHIDVKNPQMVSKNIILKRKMMQNSETFFGLHFLYRMTFRGALGLKNLVPTRPDQPEVWPDPTICRVDSLRQNFPHKSFAVTPDILQ